MLVRSRGVGVVGKKLDLATLLHHQTLPPVPRPKILFVIDVAFDANWSF